MKIRQRAPRPNCKGTRGCYNLGCGNPQCREANRVYIDRYKRDRRGEPIHGTVDGYVNWNCHCEQCREANRVYRKMMGHD